MSAIVKINGYKAEGKKPFTMTIEHKEGRKWVKVAEIETTDSSQGYRWIYDNAGRVYDARHTSRVNKDGERVRYWYYAVDSKFDFRVVR